MKREPSNIGKSTNLAARQFQSTNLEFTSIRLPHPTDTFRILIHVSNAPIHRLIAIQNLTDFSPFTGYSSWKTELYITFVIIRIQILVQYFTKVNFYFYEIMSLKISSWCPSPGKTLTWNGYIRYPLFSLSARQFFTIFSNPYYLKFLNLCYHQ